jgi:type II secretory pathway component PulK
MMNLNELLTHENKQVADLAARVSRYKTLLNSNQINEEEFKSLSDQLLDLKTIQDAAETDAQKRMLEEAVKALRIICSLL